MGKIDPAGVFVAGFGSGVRARSYLRRVDSCSHRCRLWRSTKSATKTPVYSVANPTTTETRKVTIVANLGRLEVLQFAAFEPKVALLVPGRKIPGVTRQVTLVIA